VGGSPVEVGGQLRVIGPAGKLAESLIESLHGYGERAEDLVQLIAGRDFQWLSVLIASAAPPAADQASR
jgi:hypothetical protein